MSQQFCPRLSTEGFRAFAGYDLFPKVHELVSFVFHHPVFQAAILNVADMEIKKIECKSKQVYELIFSKLWSVLNNVRIDTAHCEEVVNLFLLSQELLFRLNFCLDFQWTFHFTRLCRLEIFLEKSGTNSGVAGTV